MAATLLVEPPPQPGSGYKLGQLKQKHPEYDGELWEKLELLWEGGWAIEKNAQKFILQAPRENPAYYDWRCKSTSYINYLARLVGYLTGSLFNETLNVAPGAEEGAEPKPVPDKKFYSDFGTNCDRRGTDFSQFVRAEALAKALVFRRALVQVDLPVAQTMSGGAPPVTLEQEDTLGNRRAYLIPVDITSVFNWNKDQFGNFEWCVLHRIHQDRSSPFADSSKYQHEFKVWRMGAQAAEFLVLRTIAVKNDNELTDDMDLEVTQPWKSTSFRQIPIKEFELPKALWAGNQAGPLCQEHFRRRSDLMGSLCRSLVEMPYVKLGPEIPGVHQALPSERGSDPNRGDNVREQVQEQGQVTLGSEDEIGYAGPSGVGHEIARAEAKDVREEIFASVNAMALQLENSAAALGRSGDSKAEDKSALETLLTFMGDQVREYAQQLMGLVSEVRREDVEWVATGLSTFDQEDRTEVVAEAVQLAAVRIPSPTWARIHATNVALATVPKASSDEKKQIAEELKNGITDEEVTMDPFEKAQRMTIAQTPPAVPGEEGAPPPKGKARPKGKKPPAKE